jgi:hypothetical protein
MKCRFVFMWGAALWLSSPSAHAVQMTISDLHEICSATDEVSKAACRFYILGVTEGAGMGAGIAHDQRHFCTPEGVTSEKMVSIVKEAMKIDLAAFPQDKDMPAVSFVTAAMMRAYPCQK